MSHGSCGASAEPDNLFSPLQREVAAVRSPSAMRKPVSLLAALLLTADFASSAIETPKNQPIEITSTGQTTYENGLATARDNVAIHIGDTDIYSDFAQYNSQKHEVFVEGHVRIYRDVNLYVGERAVYNIDTKQIRAEEMRSQYDPYFV
jgi:lipopolysaccharide assembly outer membrane protein LptD (OstA)